MTTESPQRKRGKLSKDEEQFILKNVHDMEIPQIAETLNRTTEPVIRYIKENNLISANKLEENDMARLKKLLHSRPYWKEIKKQLSEEGDEIEGFEDGWINMMQQFREDVLYSEELQIKQWMILEILINRSMKDRKQHQQEADRLQTVLNEEYDKSDENRDKMYLANLEAQLTFCRAAITNYTNEHTKLLNEVKFISKSLKANRDERIKRIEDGKSTFQGLLRMLEDEEARARMGDDAELMRLAKNAAVKRLSVLHQYEDGKVDQPFLTPETYDPELHEG
jgi:hypothetical protein